MTTVVVAPFGKLESTVIFPVLSMEIPLTTGSMDQTTAAFNGNNGPSGTGYMA